MPMRLRDPEAQDNTGRYGRGFEVLAQPLIEGPEILLTVCASIKVFVNEPELAANANDKTRAVAPNPL